MKKSNLTIIVLFTILSFTVSSCIVEEKQKTVITDQYETSNFEKIGWPVKLHYIEKAGMQYMIASGTYGESGTAITNLTLDSLKTEYYLRELESR